MDKVKEIYEKIKDELDELKVIAQNKIYDKFSKNRRYKETIDESESLEIGLRKFLGDNYYYSFLENEIMMLLDPYISNNNSTNFKIPTRFYYLDSPVNLQPEDYKRISNTYYYKLYRETIDGDFMRLDVFDDNPADHLLFDDDIFSEEYKEPILYEDVKEIEEIISNLGKCEYVGFVGMDDGNFHEVYIYKKLILIDFTVALYNGKLNVLKLEMSGDLEELKNMKK